MYDSELYGFDELDEDFFEDFEDLESDELSPLSFLGAAAGAGLGGAAGTGLYDVGSAALRKGAEATGLIKKKPVKWLADNVGDEKARIGSYIRSAFGNIGAGLGGFAGGLISEDADPLEPEFTAEDIDQMEALAEEAVEAEGEDAILAADEMVSRGFGVMQAATRLKPAITALRDRVRRLVVMAKRDPRYRAPARLAPLALRRSVVVLMRLAASGRPPTARTAMMIFEKALGELSRSPRLRAAALRQAQARARRHRTRHGAPAPVAARRPVVATRPAPRRPVQRYA